MSESDKIRLDPATLRWVASALGEAWGRPSGEGPGALIQRSLARVVGAITQCANEAEARAPRLSDWVRAAETSKLGAPKWHAREWDDTGWLVGYWDGRWEKVLLCVDSAPTREVTVTTDPRNPGLDAKAADYATPAELTAVLDRLAEESSRG